jgi:hypothetical protein
VAYCGCEPNRIADWEIGPDGGFCRVCELKVAPGDVRRMFAVALTAARKHPPPIPDAECPRCGKPYVRGRAEWATCLACELEEE